LLGVGKFFSVFVLQIGLDVVVVVTNRDGQSFLGFILVDDKGNDFFKQLGL